MAPLFLFYEKKVFFFFLIIEVIETLHMIFLIIINYDLPPRM